MRNISEYRVFLFFQKVSKTGHRVKGVGSKKLRLMNNKQKPASSDGSSDTGDVSFQARLHEIAKKEEVRVSHCRSLVRLLLTRVNSALRL